MSIPRPSVYDSDFLKYPILPTTSRGVKITKDTVAEMKRCCAVRSQNYEIDFSWAETAGAHTGRAFVIAGGRNTKGHLASNVLIGACTTELEKAHPLPSPRARHAMTTLPDGSPVVIGGVTVSNDGCLELARDVLRFDEKSDSWEVLEHLPKRASQLVAECVGNSLYVIAGDTGPVSEPERPIYPAVCRDDVQILDIDSLKWRFGTPKPTPETGVTSAINGRQIYVCSSYLDNGTINAILEIYDTASDRWSKAPDMPTPRTGVPVGFIDGKLYCVNGLGRGSVSLSLIEVFDPSTMKWEILDFAPPPCHSAAYINVNGQEIHILGGRI